MLRRVTLPVLALAALTSCAALNPVEPATPGAALIGSWDNLAQMAAAPSDLKRQPTIGGAWLDAQYATFHAVHTPALAGPHEQSIYLVWRKDGPDGPISRQRLWVFRPQKDGGLIMDFYAFKTPEILANLSPTASAFGALTPEDLISYGPACSLPVIRTTRGWTASIPSSCTITATRSGRRMTLSATLTLTGNTFSYEEKGVLESGELAFKVPGGPAYVFNRKGPAS